MFNAMNTFSVHLMYESYMEINKWINLPIVQHTEAKPIISRRILAVGFIAPLDEGIQSQRIHRYITCPRQGIITKFNALLNHLKA